MAKPVVLPHIPVWGNVVPGSAEDKYVKQRAAEKAAAAKAVEGASEAKPEKQGVALGGVGAEGSIHIIATGKTGENR